MATLVLGTFTISDANLAPIWKETENQLLSNYDIKTFVPLMT